MGVRSIAGRHSRPPATRIPIISSWARGATARSITTPIIWARFKWDGDTALQFRRDVLLPFFNQYLKDGAPKANTPHVFIYNTGENHWDRFADWPLAGGAGKPGLTPIYLSGNSSLSFAKPTGTGGDSYVSDPAKPIPYVNRPVNNAIVPQQWQTWLVSDQRPASTRPDVLTYETAPLDKPTRISGAPIADLFAATTGTDGDFVVKLIDVYPKRSAVAARAWRLPARGLARHLPRPLSPELREADRDPSQPGTGI